MKDSGVEWIGEIPKNWDVMKLLFVLRSPITDGPHETPNLVESQEGIPFISVDSLNNTKQVDLSIVKKYISVKDYKEYRKKAFLEKGDVLFTKAATIGKTAIVDNPTEYMIWSPIAILKPSKKCFNEYLYYILNCKEAIKYTRDIIGHETTQVNVGMRDLEKLKIPIAPFDEQKRIAIFLDSKCEAIDQAIQKQKDIVDKLMEYKQSTITQAITKGLNPNSEMKDSGVEWIGEIPQNWSIMRLKYAYDNSNGNAVKVGPFGSQLKSSSYVSSGEWVYNQRTVLDENFETNDTFVSKEKANSLSGFKVYPNDILITTRGTLGHIAIVPNNAPSGILHPCIIRFRIDSNIINPRLLKYMFNNSDFFIKQIELTNNSTTIDALYSYNLCNLVFPVIPLSEQKNIIDFLDLKCLEIDESIERSNKIIQKLEEYKKSLIYNAITGKIDCRGEVK